MCYIIGAERRAMTSSYLSFNKYSFFLIISFLLTSRNILPLRIHNFYLDPNSIPSKNRPKKKR